MRDPMQVHCANCLAAPREICTTIYGNPRSPHAPRVKLAASPEKGPDCGAQYGEPCLQETGEIKFYPHQAGMKVHANS